MDERAYRALREGAAFYELGRRGNIRATGEDRVRLLHAMTTNHVEQLAPGTGCYAFFLNSQGRILADVHIFCMPDYLLLDTEPELREKVVQHLDKFIIADDVTLHDFSDAMTTIGLSGPEAGKVLAQLGAASAHVPFAIAEWGNCLVAHISYVGGPGYMLFVPIEERSDVAAQISSAGVHEARLPELEAVRLENHHPLYGVDFGETNIPHETQLMHALHFSKGCYLGQEIVERVRSRGHPNRALTMLALDTSTAPSRGAEVVAADGKVVGVISSAAWSPALGVSLCFAVIRAEALKGTLRVDGVSARAHRAAS